MKQNFIEHWGDVQSHLTLLTASSRLAEMAGSLSELLPKGKKK